MTSDMNGNNKKEIKQLERRLHDEQLNSIEKNIFDHEKRIKSNESIVGGWKSERRVFMYAIGSLNVFIALVLVAIFLNVSSIKTEIATQNAKQAVQITKLEGKLNNLKIIVINTKETFTIKIKNLKNLIDINTQLKQNG